MAVERAVIARAGVRRRGWLLLAALVILYGIVGEMDRRDAERARRSWPTAPVAAVYGVECERALYAGDGDDAGR